MLHPPRGNKKQKQMKKLYLSCQRLPAKGNLEKQHTLFPCTLVTAKVMTYLKAFCIGSLHHETWSPHDITAVQPIMTERLHGLRAWFQQDDSQSSSNLVWNLNIGTYAFNQDEHSTLHSLESHRETNQIPEPCSCFQKAAVTSEEEKIGS